MVAGWTARRGRGGGGGKKGKEEKKGKGKGKGRGGRGGDQGGVYVDGGFVANDGVFHECLGCIGGHGVIFESFRECSLDKLCQHPESQYIAVV